ncbi:DUF1223 domain-containing protein [Halovulum dunhuangense]|uniref:DUF1223 domain-containing protein n=1 Tax=Halovulum dunhuangense TaxID=1505036 RepID=A0A849L417_9RHOB|nr:DUF1223 domain-containing protein [Halovulum dunhuangense]NNU81003.1 DUF1223 domain-containing protein [Halovulum dunhuangense]
MRIFKVLVTVSVAAIGGMAQAQDRPVLVELFTSQGCSSCPPADELLKELGRQDGVIALAYHVDYWDYLGWEDTFAQPEFTARQLGYADRVDRQWIGRKLRGSFTPEAVVQGSDSLVGSNRAALEARIAAHQALPERVDIALERDGDGVRVRFAPSAGDVGPESVLFVATYMPSAVVEIERGENAGREIAYTNVVTGLIRYARWDGQGPGEVRVPNVEPPLAAFLQQGDDGPVVAVARLE